MKYGICLGINDYSWLSPSASLRGCVRDAWEWGELFADYFGFDEIHLLTDAAATPSGLQSAISRVAERAVAGDLVAITYSGHGTQVPDTDGDEPDGYDEAIVLYGQVYNDDAIHGDLSVFSPDIKVVLVSDSCHSGTVTRGLPVEMLAGPDKAHPMLPRTASVGDIWRPGGAGSACRCLHHRFGASRGPADASRILLAGCKASETSMDAWLAHAYHGALTYHAVRLLQEDQHMTWREFGVRLAPCVARTSPQTPQVEGAPEALDGVVF